MSCIEKVAHLNDEEHEHEFMKKNWFGIYEYSKRPEHIAYLIKRLASVEASKYIYTMNLSVDVLRCCDDLLEALKAFAAKPNNVTEIVLERRDKRDEYDERYNIDHVIDILNLFKNVTSVKLVLRHKQYSINEINLLKNYFERTTNIKNLSLKM